MFFLRWFEVFPKFFHWIYIDEPLILLWCYRRSFLFRNGYSGFSSFFFDNYFLLFYVRIRNFRFFFRLLREKDLLYKKGKLFDNCHQLNICVERFKMLREKCGKCETGLKFSSIKSRQSTGNFHLLTKFLFFLYAKKFGLFWRNSRKNNPDLAKKGITF